MMKNLKFTQKDCGTSGDRKVLDAAHIPFPSSQNLIEAKLTVNGRVFRTRIPEGATVNELIVKVAKENGESVEKKYYPEFGTSEITRIRIGDTILEKGKGSTGIHFYLSESGIPVVTRSENLVFPNADELRIRKELLPISLQRSAVNFNPVKKVRTFFRSFFKQAPETERLSE